MRSKIVDISRDGNHTPSFGTRGSQVQILPLRPLLSWSQNSFADGARPVTRMIVALCALTLAGCSGTAKTDAPKLDPRALSTRTRLTRIRPASIRTLRMRRPARTSACKWKRSSGLTETGNGLFGARTALSLLNSRRSSAVAALQPAAP